MTSFWRMPGAKVAVLLLVVVGICALAPQLVVLASPGPHDPNACSLRAADGSYQDRLAPSTSHWFGTDLQGCDEFARVVYGTRSSVGIALAATIATTVLGTLLGLMAGWRGGWLDALVRRLADITFGVPFMVGAVLLLAVVAGEQRGPWHLVLAMTVLLWPGPARYARNAARAIVARPFVEATRAVGAGSSRIVLRHVLPNALPGVIAFATPLVGLLIASEATLSYLGIGLRVPSVSWGLMIDQAQGSLARAPHLLLFPGALLAAAITGFVLLGDAVNAVLDGHERTR